MKNRNIILTVTLSLLVCGGLSCMAQGGPDVTVVNTPNVNVVNTATNPVPVTGVVASAENPARSAVQQSITLPAPGGGSGVVSQVILNLPANGKIFVLETVSFHASTPLLLLQIEVVGPLITGGQGGVSYDLVIPSATAADTQGGSQALRLYAQPGTQIFFTASSNAGGTIDVSLSGYFVNAQ